MANKIVSLRNVALKMPPPSPRPPLHVVRRRLTPPPTRRKERVEAGDAVLGSRIKEGREQRKMSQAALGKLIDVTFQQIQKYEKGRNRVSGARLAKIAEVLDRPLEFFYGSQIATPVSVMDTLKNEDVLKMVRSFTSIKNTELRRQIVVLTEFIAEMWPA